MSDTKTSEISDNSMSQSDFSSRYFHQPINIFCEFLPQLLFLLAMFGYLNALIFAKWLLFTADDASCAPSLLIGELRHENIFLLRPKVYR